MCYLGVMYECMTPKCLRLDFNYSNFMRLQLVLKGKYSLQPIAVQVNVIVCLQGCSLDFLNGYNYNMRLELK